MYNVKLQLLLGDADASEGGGADALPVAGTGDDGGAGRTVWFLKKRWTVPAVQHGSYH